MSQMKTSVPPTGRDAKHAMQAEESSDDESDDDESASGIHIEGAYDPAEYAHLPVSAFRFLVFRRITPSFIGEPRCEGSVCLHSAIQTSRCGTRLHSEVLHS